MKKTIIKFAVSLAAISLVAALVVFAQRTEAQTIVGFCYNWNTNLKVGSSGPDVTALKQALTLEGWVQNDSTVFDEALAEDVSAFQEKYAWDILISSGLRKGTGQVGAPTRAKLNQLYGCEGSTGETKGWVNICYVFGRNLGIGSTGQEVTLLQRWLIDRGFDIPSIVRGKTPYGYFGPETAVALSMYQASVKIESTGYFGLLTRTAVNEEIRKKCGSDQGRVVATIQNKSIKITQGVIGQSSTTVSANFSIKLSAVGSDVSLGMSDASLPSVSLDVYGNNQLLLNKTGQNVRTFSINVTPSLPLSLDREITLKEGDSVVLNVVYEFIPVNPLYGFYKVGVDKITWKAGGVVGNWDLTTNSGWMTDAVYSPEGDAGKITITNPRNLPNLQIGKDLPTSIVWSDTRHKNITPIYVISRSSSEGKGVISENVDHRTYCPAGQVCEYRWTPGRVSNNNQLTIYDRANDPNALYVGRSGVFNVVDTITVTPIYSISISSPNGGERYTNDGLIRVNYSSQRIVGSKVTLYLTDTMGTQYFNVGPYPVVSESGTFEILLAKGVSPLPPGQYRVNICSDIIYYGRNVCDSSDSYFTVTAQNPTPRTPDVPAISSVTGQSGIANEAKPGESVTLRGTNFSGGNAGNPSVYIGGQVCLVTSSSDTSITCTAPNLTTAGYYGLFLMNSYGRSNDVQVRVNVSTPVAPNITLTSAPANRVNGFVYTITSQVPFDRVTLIATCNNSEVGIGASGGMLCNERWGSGVSITSPTTQYSQTIDFTSKDGKSHSVMMNAYGYSGTRLLGSDTELVTVTPTTPVVQPAPEPAPAVEMLPQTSPIEAAIIRAISNFFK